MRKRILMTLMGVLSVCSMAFADDRNYSGTVVNEDGEPIMGATVTVTGTTVSTLTDMDGRFMLVVPDGYETVTITYSGMKKQVVNVQREPIMLYASADAAQQARLAVVTKPVKPVAKKRNYKKNAFNLEQSFGAFRSLDGERYNMFELSYGWKHNFSQYIGWHVFDVSVAFSQNLSGGDNEYDHNEYFHNDYHYFDKIDPENQVRTYNELFCEPVLKLATGIILRSPNLGKFSLFASTTAGIGVQADGWEYVAPVVNVRAGINISKWFYVAYKYSWIAMDVEYDERYSYTYYDTYYKKYRTAYDYNYGLTKKIKTGTHAISIGFNF
ncbi:MAG: carboxypeptidase-like regulatory domain-containing protein [Bacteroidaceae bacterium]